LKDQQTNQLGNVNRLLFSTFVYNMRLNLFLFVFIGSFSLLHGQDTIRIYFEFGSSKISYESEQVLRDLKNRFDLHSVELVEFTGYADSIGNLKSNLRLCEKRAKNAYNVCQGDFKPTVEVNILAKGEGTKASLDENRRVEIVLHYDEMKEKEGPLEIIENMNPRCFFVDFEALQFCNLREITKGRKKYVYIEALDIGLFTEREHYYAIRNNSGKVTIQRLRWKKKVTGKLWWRKTRYVAFIPKESFDRFQFFTLEDAPCTGCKEEILTKDTVIMNVAKFYTDYFLLTNMQAKQRFIDQNQLKVRVPKEYVDLNETYYFTGNPGGIVEWTTRDFGSKNKNYYFADIELYNGKMPEIQHLYSTTVCLNTSTWKDWNARPWYCGFVNDRGNAIRNILSIDPGVFYHNDSLVGYLALGVNYIDDHSFSFQAGINTHASLYAAANYRFNLLSFRMRALSIRDNWVDPFELNMSSFANTIVRPYVGLDTKTSFNQGYQSFFEANVNAGFLVRLPIKNWVGDFFIQGGVSYDFLQRINTQAYGYGQIGVRFYPPFLYH
jgi:hypothetical protein